MPSEYPTRQQMENQADLLRRIANAGYAGIPTPAGANPNYQMIQKGLAELPPQAPLNTQIPTRPPMPQGLQSMEELRSLTPTGMYSTTKVPSTIPLEIVLQNKHNDQESNIFAQPVVIGNKQRGLSAGFEIPLAGGHLEAEANYMRRYGAGKQPPDVNLIAKYKRNFADGGMVDGESLTERIGPNTQLQINGMMSQGGFAGYAKGGEVSPLAASRPSAIDSIRSEFEKRGLDFDKFISQPAVIQEAVKHAADMGINGDTMLAHINPREAQLLKDHGGSGKTNPKTGLPMFEEGDGSGEGQGGQGEQGGQGSQGEQGSQGNQGEQGSQGSQGEQGGYGGGMSPDSTGPDGLGGYGGGTNPDPAGQTTNDVTSGFSNTPDSLAGFSGLQSPETQTVNDVTSSFSTAPDKTPGFDLQNNTFEAPAAVAYDINALDAIDAAKAAAMTVDRNPSMTVDAQQAKAEAEFNEAMSLMNNQELAAKSAFAALTSTPMSVTPEEVTQAQEIAQKAAVERAIEAIMAELTEAPAAVAVNPSTTPAPAATPTSAQTPTSTTVAAAAPAPQAATPTPAQTTPGWSLSSVLSSLNPVNSLSTNPVGFGLNTLGSLANPAIGLANLGLALSGNQTLGSHITDALGLTTNGVMTADSSTSKSANQEPGTKGESPSYGGFDTAAGGASDSLAGVLNSLANTVPQTTTTQKSNASTTPTLSNRTFAGYAANPLLYGYGPAQNYYTYAAKGGHISPLNAKRKAK